MKLSTLLTLGLATALFGAVTVVGCSEPDVASFQGSNAQPSAGGDDDDDDDDKGHPKTTNKGGDDDDILGDDDESGKKDKKKKDDKTDTGDTTPTVPEKPVTHQECFTHCIGPVPEAVALDACSNKCDDNDTDCLGDCFITSNCDANPQCEQAIDQCGKKCPADP